MRLAILLISFSLFSCSLFEKKIDQIPLDINIGTLSLNKESVYLSYGLFINTQTKNRSDLPINQMDKFILISPQDFDKLLEFYKTGGAK